MTTIIIIIVLISALRLLWKINNKNHSGTANKEKKKRKGTVKHYYQNSYSKDKRPKEEVNQFKQPDLEEKSSNQEEEKEIVWNKEFLMSMEWKVFEDVCQEYLRLKNCSANVTNIGKDGGIDLKVTDNTGNVIAIGQCKAWTKPINVKEIRELYGIMAAEKVRNGIYITTSTFTNDAQEFGNNKRLLLINGDEFIKSINELDEVNKTLLENVAKSPGYNIPTCVSCNIKMVKRTSHSGYNKGSMFWGCRNYPKCKITLPVRKEFVN